MMMCSSTLATVAKVVRPARSEETADLVGWFRRRIATRW
jgi:hypothetical protein